MTLEHESFHDRFPKLKDLEIWDRWRLVYRYRIDERVYTVWRNTTHNVILWENALDEP